MRVAIFLFVVFALVLVGSFGFNRRTPAAQTEPPLQLKDVRDRGIEGTLGRPLGTVVEVSGKVIANESLAKVDMGEPFFLRIDAVDGRKLATPTSFPSSKMPLALEAP